MDGVYFRLLGPLVVCSGGAESGIRASRQRVALAAMLTRAGQPVSVDELTELIWDGAPPPGAEDTLRTYVMRLRRALGPVAGARVLTRAPGYLVEAATDEVDLLTFADLYRTGEAAFLAGDWATASAALRESLALWRGEPFADIPSSRLRAAEAPPLAERRAQALAWRAEANLNLGATTDVVAELRDLVAEYPLTEHLHALLIRALAGGGRLDDARTAYQRASEVLVDRLGIDPGPELRGLHAEITARVRVPRQLPAVDPYFTGRRDELLRLGSQLDHDADVVATSAIEGAAGIGKTALALQWAHQVAGRFPEGQLYADLRGFDPSGRPVSPDDVVYAFIAALQDPDQPIPPGRGERLALYHSLLAGRRLLMVLDNARDVEQVRELLPRASGCVAIVTSRNRLTGLAGSSLTLNTLSGAEAYDLLIGRLGRRRLAGERAAAGEIIAATAGLPLALCVVAARAAIRPDLSLVSLAAQLRQAGLDAMSSADPRSDLRAVFSWSLRQLAPAAASMFQRLGLHPGPRITVAAAGSLAGVGEPEAGRLLATLAQAHLIIERPSGWFTFHDLIRAYAVEQAGLNLPPRERQDAVARLTGWYVYTAGAADAALDYRDVRVPPDFAYRPDRVRRFASHEEADGWFADERENIGAIVRAAHERGLHSGAWQLTALSWNQLYRIRFLTEWMTMLTTGLEAARHDGDQNGERRILNLLGMCHRLRGELDEAIDCLERSLLLAATAGHSRARYVALDNLATTYIAAERTEDAIRSLSEALSLVTEAGDGSGAATVLNNMGEAYRLAGRHDEAISALRKALDLASVDDAIRVYILATLAQTYRERGDHRAAIENARLGLPMARRGDHRQVVATLLDSLGTGLSALGEATEAAAALSEAADLYEGMGITEVADEIRARLASSGMVSP